jgi:hypothetical protein
MVTGMVGRWMDLSAGRRERQTMATDLGVLGVQVRVLEEALHSREFRHNALARAIFEARLLALRLDSMAAETPSVQSQAIHTRLMRYAHTPARSRRRSRGTLGLLFSS